MFKNATMACNLSAGVGSTVRNASGQNAPIVIENHVFGNHEAVKVSQNHRIFINSPKAELMFGASEVSIAAKHLLSFEGGNEQVDGKPITYINFMFDQHEIVTVGGLESESFHTGQHAISELKNKQREEILNLFPSLKNVVS